VSREGLSSPTTEIIEVTVKMLAVKISRTIKAAVFHFNYLSPPAQRARINKKLIILNFYCRFVRIVHIKNFIY